LFLRLRALAIFLLKIRVFRRLSFRQTAKNFVYLKEVAMSTGTVKFFNATKGFGFIEQADGGADVFVHISAVERSGMMGLAEGQKLTFDVVKDNRNGKSSAENLVAA
jgi:CspA family cold shock protein